MEESSPPVQEATPSLIRLFEGLGIFLVDMIDKNRVKRGYFHEQNET